MGRSTKPAAPAVTVDRQALESISSYLARLVEVIEALPREPAAAIATRLIEAARAERTVYILGNGGSAATASHLVCDLVKTAHAPGHPQLRAVALTDNVPLMTAIGNDLAYGEIFAEQVRRFARPGDVVLAISASGNSPNIVAGALAAREVGADVIGLTGFGGGRLQALSDLCLVVPSDEYGPVEDLHLILVHALTAAIRARLDEMLRAADEHTGEAGDGTSGAASAEAHALPRPIARTFAPRAAAPTIFLDRDGVINRNRDDYVKSWDEFAFLPGAREAIAELSRAGHRIFVVSNQACIGKGLTSLAAVDDLHQRMVDAVARAGGRIDGVLVCPHRAEAGCACRKPLPGLLLRARDEFGVDLTRAMLVGDSLGDLGAAAAVGVPAVLVLSGLGWEAAQHGAAGQEHVRWVARDLGHATRLITGSSILARMGEPWLRLAIWARRFPRRGGQLASALPAALVPMPGAPLGAPLGAGEIAAKVTRS